MYRFGIPVLLSTRLRLASLVTNPALWAGFAFLLHLGATGFATQVLRYN